MLWICTTAASLLLRCRLHDSHELGYLGMDVHHHCRSVGAELRKLATKRAVIFLNIKRVVYTIIQSQLFALTYDLTKDGYNVWRRQ